MKVITIGRDPSCNIVINDPKISRRHAIVRVSDFGKIEVVDLSTNGTSVNGNPLRKNVPYPVTRNNQVTFAGVSKLNWDDIPNPFKLYKWIAIGLFGLIALAIAVTAIVKAVGSDDEPIVTQQPPAAAVTTPGTSTPKNGSKTAPADKNKAKDADAENIDDNTGNLLKPVAPHRPAAKVEAPAKEDKKDQNGKTEKVNNKANSGSKNNNQNAGKKAEKKTQKTDPKQSADANSDGKTETKSQEKKKTRVM